MFELINQVPYYSTGAPIGRQAKEVETCLLSFCFMYEGSLNENQDITLKGPVSQGRGMLVIKIEKSFFS